MVTITGTYDGQKLILDGPVEGIPPHSRVRISIEQDLPRGPFDSIVGIIKDSDLPPDFAAQHEHYMYGTPKR